MYEYTYIIFFENNHKFNIAIIQDRIKEMFYGLLQNIGYHDNHDETDSIKYLRQEAVKWACILDALECRKTATSQLEKNLKISAQDMYVILQYIYL